MFVRRIGVLAAVFMCLCCSQQALATACAGDIANDDGQVNVSDLLELLGNWGTDGNGSDIAEPLDTVDVSDLLELLSQWGECPFPACGADDAGSCFMSNGSPGCVNEDCCKTVCETDPFCCDNTWDSLCAETALETCSSDACPGEGSCYANNGTPGCDDAECCNLVCEVDAFCCDSSWDGICAEEAAELCAGCGDSKAGSCFAGNGSPGCDDAECCGDVCAEDPFCCDTEWDSLCAEQATEICANCGSAEAGSCFESNGSPGCDDAECCGLVCTEDPFCCESEWDSLCVDQAAGLCGNCGSSDAGSCFEANGTPGCDDLDCCASVCAIDPFCCETEWDSLCADEAAETCGNCGSPDAGSCFIANGTPGCDNSECCAAVCEMDPFCCNTEWDSLCAQQTEGVCDVPACGPDCGDDKENVECLSGQQYDNRRFVGRLLTNGGLCTAWIVGGPDIVMTNGHCVGSSDVPSDFTVEFNRECSLCTGGVLKPVDSFDVTEIIVDNDNADYALLRLEGSPADTYGQASIDPSGVSVGTPIYEIHHAGGQAKGTDVGEILKVNQNVNCPGDVAEHHVSVIASGGASGSPVFRETNDCVVAICNCGPDCAQGYVVPIETVMQTAAGEIIDAGGNLNLCNVSNPACPGSGDCFSANGTPGCNDTACCNEVCFADPFCCETEWDALCADEASVTCQ